MWCVGKDMKKTAFAAKICGTFCGVSHLIGRSLVVDIQEDRDDRGER